MVVVSDTSPLSAMAKLGWLDWLRERWKVVMMPQEVWDELEKIGDEVAWNRLLSARSANWLRVAVAPNSDRTPPELSKLDPGEIAAILLALGLGAERMGATAGEIASQRRRDARRSQWVVSPRFYDCSLIFKVFTHWGQLDQFILL